MFAVLLRSWLYLALRDWRERYPRAVSLAAEVFGIALSIAVYWYTARAFSGHTDFAGEGYFGYVMLGEASLLVPLGLLGGLARAAREAHDEGVLEVLLTMPWSGSRVLLLLGLPGALREGARALTLVLVAAMATQRLAATPLLAWLLVQAAALPAFVALAIGATAWFFRFGRGEGVVTYASTIAAILAGTYFPVALLPDALGRAAATLSPFNTLLEGSRRAFVEASGGATLHACGKLLLWGAVLLPLATLALNLSLHAVRRRGSVEAVP